LGWYGVWWCGTELGRAHRVGANVWYFSRAADSASDGLFLCEWRVHEGYEGQYARIVEGRVYILVGSTHARKALVQS
jgi:hypothetical protein